MWVPGLRARRGRWERVLPRVFAVGVDPLDAAVRVRSAWLWAGEDSVVGGHAAAWWLGLRPDPPGWVHVYVPPSRRMTTQPNVWVIRAVIDPAEAVTDSRVTITAAERACLDLARQGRADGLESRSARTAQQSTI